MSSKGKGKNLISTRTLLIMALVACIAIAAYFLITSYTGDSEDILTVKATLDRSDELIESQEEITVKGYYAYYNENTATVTDVQVLPGSPQPENKLLVDHSGVEDTPEFTTSTKYFFTGVLQKDEQNPDLIILIASKIE